MSGSATSAELYKVTLREQLIKSIRKGILDKIEADLRTGLNLCSELQDWVYLACTL